MYDGYQVDGGDAVVMSCERPLRSAAIAREPARVRPEHCFRSSSSSASLALTTPSHRALAFPHALSLSAAFVLILARRGAAEPTAAIVLAWLGLTAGDDSAKLCGTLSIVLLGLRTLLSLPLINHILLQRQKLASANATAVNATLGGADKSRATPHQDVYVSPPHALLLALVPFNLELVQCLPWTGAVHDGMPTSLAMAAAAGLSLSHGSSLLLLLLWLYAKDGPPSTDMLLVLVLSTAASLCFLGVRRVWKLMFTATPSAHEPSAASRATDFSNLQSSCASSYPSSHVPPGEHSVAESSNQPDAAAVHLRSIQRQQAALVAMRARALFMARNPDAAPQMLPPVAVRYLDGPCSAATSGSGQLVVSRVERASAANSARRDGQSGDGQQAGPRAVKAVVVRRVRSTGGEHDARTVARQLTWQSSEYPSPDGNALSESCVGSGSAVRAVIASHGLEDRPAGGEDEANGEGQMVSGEGDRIESGNLDVADVDAHTRSRVQRACTANIAQRAERAHIVQVRTQRARSSNRATRERLESEHAHAASAVAAVEQWRPSGVDASPQWLEPQLSFTPTTADPQSSSHDSPDDAARATTTNSISDHDQATRLDRARHSNRVRRAREAFAGDAAINPEV